MLDEHDQQLLTSPTGQDFIREVGIEVVRSVVLDILTGRNLRDSTEVITRKRIGALNLALVDLFVNGSQTEGFIANLPFLAAEVLKTHRTPKSERLLAQWALGLTSKGVQNILRDKAGIVDEYRDKYVQACKDVILAHELHHGALSGVLKLESPNQAIPLDWLSLTYLLSMVGAQTLTTRGSQKSAYGKLFEKLILGSLLSVFGFSLVPPANPDPYREVFWLSSREGKRESDATLLYDLGKAVRFDIGFIGRGNSEISLDKVSRYRRVEELGGKEWYVSTVIIVDRIGKRSQLPQAAQAVDGRIVQMSASYWPQEVAGILHETLGFEHELVNMKAADVDDYLAEALKRVSLEAFLAGDEYAVEVDLTSEADANDEAAKDEE